MSHSVQLAKARIPRIGESVGVIVDGVPWWGRVTELQQRDDVVTVTVEGVGGEVWQPILVLPSASRVDYHEEWKP